MNHGLLPSVNGAALPAKYEAAKLSLAECNRIDECKDWSDKAAAMASYAKQAKDQSLVKMAMKIGGRALKRCGELMNEIEREKGGRPKTNTGSDISLSPLEQAAKDAGLSKRQKDTALQISNIPDDEFEEMIESDDPPTITALADHGKKKRDPIKTYLDRGITEREFKAGMHGFGNMKHYLSTVGEFEPQEIVNGVEDKDELIKTIDLINAHHEAIKAIVSL